MKMRGGEKKDLGVQRKKVRILRLGKFALERKRGGSCWVMEGGEKTVDAENIGFPKRPDAWKREGSWRKGS